MTMVYHELRAPLGLVVSAALSAADECDDAYIRGRCEMIARAAERMLRTADEFLHVQQPDVGSADGFAPATIVEDAVRDLRGLAVPVRFEAPASLRFLRCGGDPATFETLFYSIFANATDHSADDAPVTVELFRDRGEIELRVTNLVTGDDDHAGLGAGKFIEQALASALGATITAGRKGICYVSSLRLPVLKADACSS